MHRSIEYGMSVACGAFVGALLSNALIAPLWWVGAMAGGLFGYLVVDPRKIATAFMQALRIVYGLRPDTEFWRRVGMLWLLMAMIVLTFDVMASGVKIFFGSDPTEDSFAGRRTDFGSRC